ncbi:MAG: hypothetical protein FK734_15325 [Asgard group archaeon]|nr:hypothetical protein [Asgard group archaeon]
MAFTDKVIDGGDILLKVDGNVIGCATSHQIEVSNAVRETSFKGSGVWTGAEYGRFSWSGSTDSLFNLIDDSYVRYVDLWDLFVSKTLVTISSTYEEGSDTFVQEGQAVITSINKTAGDSDNASFSVNFQGRGPLAILGRELWAIAVTATGATHIVVEELNRCFAYSGGGALDIYLMDGTYHITAFDESSAIGRGTVTVDGANDSISVPIS